MNKTRTFIAPCFSSLCRVYYVQSKTKRKFYAHTLLEPSWMKKVIIYNFGSKVTKDSIFSINRTSGVFCFISKRNIETGGVLWNKFPIFHRKTPMLESLFNKVAVLNLEFYQKRDSGADIFLWFFRNFEERFFLQKSGWATTSVVQWFSQHLEFHN